MTKARKKRPPSPISANVSQPPSPYVNEKNLRYFCEVTANELSKALGALVGELDYGLFNSSPAVRERAMHVALNAAQEAMTLTRNLRYFSAENRLESQIVDLSQIVLDTVDLVEKEFELRKVFFKVVAEAASFASIDSNAIQQALLNIFLHAAETMPEGGRLTVTLKNKQPLAEIRVTDSATSRSFFEAGPDAASVPGKDESGVAQLGLSVARTLVEAHGGEFSAQSIPNTGNTITLRLPTTTAPTNHAPFSLERRFRRIKMLLPVELTFSRGQNQLRTDVTVMSEGGCYVRIPEAKLMRLPEINESIALRIFYFGDQTVEIQRARIASVCWAGSLSGIGVDFMDVSDRAQKLLQALVKTQSY